MELEATTRVDDRKAELRADLTSAWHSCAATYPTGGLRQMETAFEPLHGIGLYASLPGVAMADTLVRAGHDCLLRSSDPQRLPCGPGSGQVFRLY